MQWSYVGAMGSRPLYVSFLSYFLSLTLSVNGSAEKPATLFSELGFHFSINFKRVWL